MSLSLDDGINVLGVDHAQHPVAEHPGGRGRRHDPDNDNAGLSYPICAKHVDH